MIERFSKSNTLLLICNTTEEMNQFYLELSYLLRNNQNKIHLFPDWEILPYDEFSPHPNLISSRLKILNELSHQNITPRIIITTSKTLLQRLAHKQFILASTFIFNVKDELILNNFKKQLSNAGYRHVSEVITHGEFTIKGSLVDLYPMGAKKPIRLDLYDDLIDSIRYFDPETQITTEQVDSFVLLPTHEFPLDTKAIKIFQNNWNNYFNKKYQDSSVYQELIKGNYTNNAENYLPLFFETTQTLFDYLPENLIVIYEKELETEIDVYWDEINTRYEQLRHDISKPILNPKNIYLLKNDFFKILKKYQKIIFNSNNNNSHVQELPYSQPPHFCNLTNKKNPLKELKEFIKNYQYKIIISVATKGRREILLDLLKKEEIFPKYFETLSQCFETKEKLSLCLSPFKQGVIKKDNWALFTEEEILGTHIPADKKQTSRATIEKTINHLIELNIDDYVVHLEHGIGQYKGLKIFKRGSVDTEFLILEYDQSDVLYLPALNLEYISRYSGVNNENIKKSKLGSNQWNKDKEKAEKQVTDVAAELFNLYARRAARTGNKINFNENNYLLFKNSFPFDETTDQEQAIKTVLNDLKKKKPMDRLICGDVGFGKTEVALRAAFVVADTNKQVAILTPTTLLAEQHYETFINRFADWPIQINLLSRFTPPKQQQQIIKEVNSGKTDIIIGTHKLLNEAIKFNALGLLVIDEEHRFGVKQKDKMKALRSDVDILSLTATPIPRTLGLAVNQFRDISLITTPPKETFINKNFY